MASKKFLELQEYSTEDLQGELANTEEQLVKMRFDHATKGLDDAFRLREVRRDIARIKTELRRREVAAMSAEDLAGRTKIRARRSGRRK